VGLPPHGRGRRLGFRQFDAQARQLGLDLRQTRAGHRLLPAGIGEPRARRRDRLPEVMVPPREEHLLPAAQFTAQLPVAAGLRGLALERASLLLDLEDDVVHAGQVLLRGLELQLGRAAPRLVLRDAGGFLDQMASIGRARAQDHPDLALLDDRVSLRAEARVHQELVDVPQPAVLAVNQVLALAGAVEAACDLDVAGRRLDEVGDVRHRQMAVAVTVTVAVTVAVRVGRRGRLERVHLRQQRRRQRDATQPQLHLGGAGRLARVAAAEDDVFHLLAAQAPGALLPQHPGERVGDVALAAPVRADNGGHAVVEGKLRAIGEGLESGNL
jgi:hypothetical protein